MSFVPPKLSSTQITGLAKHLDGPTGGELRRDLEELCLPLGRESTKWRMLRESFDLAQRRDGHSGSILRFISHSLGPAAELGAGDLGAQRTAVTELLLLSGVRLLEDGTMVRADIARTANDARDRADQLRRDLAARQVHSDVLRFCRAELLQQNYFHAVLEAAKSVSAKIRDKTGLETDGMELVDAAFSLQGAFPPLAFNSLQTETERSAHRGYAHFARGVVGAFRNPTAHAARVEFDLGRDDAIDMLATISMVHRCLDKAVATPAAPINQSQAA